MKTKRNSNTKKHGVGAKIAAAAAGAAVLAAAAVVVIRFTPFYDSDSLTYSEADEAMAAARELVDTVFDPQSAINILDANMKRDKDGSMKAMRDEYMTLLSNAKQREAYTHIRNYDYAAAASVLEPILPLNTDNYDPTLTALYETCQKYGNTVEWKGAVEHVFFHSLIYDPQATFTGDYQTQDFDESYVTVTEFKRFLDRFYENGFVLYDIHKLYTTNPDGTVTQNPVYVPDGKKPLVMSFDDTCYYEYMRPYGFVQGVDIDEYGNPRTFIWNADNTKTYIEDGDYQPILESFIKAHPDFTYGGAKGIIALTGYDGVLGYRTNNLDNPDYWAVVQDAQAVAEGLKNLGWTFASHSYNHRDFYERDAEWYAQDSARWEAEVVPIIGATDVYIYPFGTSPTDWNDPKQLDFLAHGFKMFCGVYKDPELVCYGNFMYMSRRNIDGISMRDGRLDSLMDISGIIQSDVRPY